MRGVSYPLSVNFFKTCIVMFMVLNGYHGMLLTKLTISERGGARSQIFLIPHKRGGGARCQLSLIPYFFESRYSHVYGFKWSPWSVNFEINYFREGGARSQIFLIP